MKKLFTIIFAFSIVHTQAQMVGTDVFLKGKYVEVGIGHLGYYGSDYNAPSGYHPHGFTKLGFVADPLMTGWSTGTTHYMGDYFLPGTPFEGWDLQISSSSIRCQGYNTGSSTSAFVTTGGTYTGGNLSYTPSGSTVSGTWQGSVDSVTITQVTTLDTNAMYFRVEITLTNTSVFPKNDIYYFRSLDPDNDETWPGGGYPTNNVINYQMPDTFGASSVTGTGYSSTLPPLTLGSPDTASRAVVYVTWPIAITQDLGAMYAETTTVGGTSEYTAGVSDPGDIAIGLLMHVPHLATVDSAGDSVLRVTSTGMRHPANSATMHYFYAFSASGLDSAIAYYKTTTTTGTGTLGIQNVNNTNEIKAYPNPARNIVNITGLEAADQITVYDMMGRATAQTRAVALPGKTTISLTNLPAGAYIIAVSDANGNTRARVPVQKQ